MGRIIKVEIVLKDGGIGIYNVGDVCEHTDITGIRYLAMSRLKDYKYGFIPMDIIESYRVLFIEGA